jgi:hypothetical protein
MDSPEIVMVALSPETIKEIMEKGYAMVDGHRITKDDLAICPVEIEALLELFLKRGHTAH